MKKLIILLLQVPLMMSCGSDARVNKPLKNEENQMLQQELVKKLEGEWAVRNDWRDSVLTFSNIKDKNFKQEIFPAYNAVVFNLENKTIAVNTYGEHGCGTAALENLDIKNSSWSVRDGVLALKFNYSDYSGQHRLENTYSVERNGKELVLRRLNKLI